MSKTLVELKPCPFPHDPSMTPSQPKPKYSRQGNCWSINCITCGARGSIRRTEQEAITAWNTREHQKQPAKWECFCDAAYFDQWAVRPVGETRWGHCFHVPSKEEADGLRDLLNQREHQEQQEAGVDEFMQEVKRRFARLRNNKPKDICQHCAEILHLQAHFEANADRWRGIASAMGYEPEAHNDVKPRSKWILDRIERFKTAIRTQPEQQRDWPEDAAHENSNYQCKCIQCDNGFTGHKRRVVCNACAKPKQQRVSEERLGELAEKLILAVREHVSSGRTPLCTAFCQILRSALNQAPAVEQRVDEDVVERVAKAIFLANPGRNKALEWHHAATPRKRYLTQAKAAIVALNQETGGDA